MSTNPNNNYDYETQSSYAVTINARDGQGAIGAVTVTINLTDENEPPSLGFSSARTSVGPAGTIWVWTPENQARVGRFIFSVPDAADSVELSPVSGDLGEFTLVVVATGGSSDRAMTRTHIVYIQGTDVDPEVPPDTIAPIFQSVAVNGSALTLTYDDRLDSGSTPAPGDFTVTVAGSAAPVSGVRVSGTKGTLMLARVVTHGQAVTVAYAVPAANPIQNLAGLNAAALTAQTATNNTPAPPHLPGAPTGLEVTTGDGEITVSWTARWTWANRPSSATTST